MSASARRNTQRGIRRSPGPRCPSKSQPIVCAALMIARNYRLRSGGTDEARGPLRIQCTSAIATLFTPLHARYSLPSFVAAMLRTTPPPEGIGVAENDFVFGSKWTRVLGLTPDSL